MNTKLRHIHVLLWIRKAVPDTSERKLESSDLKICKGTGFQLSLE
jgi:hypothetical protein